MVCKTFYNKRCHKHQHSPLVHQTWPAFLGHGDEDILQCADVLVVASQMYPQVSSPVRKLLNKFSSFSEH
jgi:hypothetical protein